MFCLLCFAERAGARDWTVEDPRVHTREGKGADAPARRLREKKKANTLSVVIFRSQLTEY